MTLGRRSKWVWAATAVAFCGSAAGAVWLSPRPTRQPLPYNHAAHTAKSDCVLCHQGSRDGLRAGLPGIQVCTGCHATPPFRGAGAPTQAQWQAWDTGDGDAPPVWNRLFRLPSHVFFSHRRHTNVAGLPCARCHGDMKDRRTPPEFPLRTLKMRDCIGCHEAEKVTTDCARCHR